MKNLTAKFSRSTVLYSHSSAYLQRLVAKCVCVYQGSRGGGWYGHVPTVPLQPPLLVSQSQGPGERFMICGIATGFAFIEFEDPRDAEDAVRDMDGRYVCGVRIRCEMAKNSSRFD